MMHALGEPEHIDRDPDPSRTIDIYAFGRNFVEECDSDSENDEGYVLVTSGMSDGLMLMPQGCNDETPAVELIWYARDLNPEYFSNLRWLAKLPFVDKSWLGFGHTIPMPEPPLSFCPFKTFLLLPPIIRPDRELFEDIEQQGHCIGTLVVHLVSTPEYNLIKSEDGLDRFLEQLDENDYPTIFDPTRASMIA
jgi:hypothetical protein